MHASDLEVSIGARFDDRATGRLDDFYPHATIVHVDIDPASINNVVPADLSVVGDRGQVLDELLPCLSSLPKGTDRLKAWWQRIDSWRAERSQA